MFAAAIPTATPWWEKLSFSWFDIVLILTLAFGIWRGRKHGMSRECMISVQWLALVLTAGLCYGALAPLLIQIGLGRGLAAFARGAFDKNATERVMAFVVAYLIIAALVLVVFTFIKRATKAKIENGNFFANSEYYLGMAAGFIRYACMVMFFLALLNAPTYSTAEIQATQAYDKKEFGGGLNKGNYFPHTFEIQEQVFKKSLAGRIIKDKLGILLIDSGASSDAKKPSKH